MSRRWRTLRAAALVLRLLRSRRAAAPTHRCTSFRHAFPYEVDGCCADEKRAMLRRIVAKPFHCRSDVDVKLLAELLRRSRFSASLSSASTDALARVLHFRVVHDGEAVFRQGDAIDDTSGRFLVVSGSLLVFSKQEDAGDCFQSSRDGEGVDRLGECIGTCNQGSSCGEDATTGAALRKTTVLAQTTSLVAFVTKADYLRIARFNVEAEAGILSDVRLLFNKPDLHSTAPARLDTAVLADRHAMRVVKRFLHRYECFRMLPHDILLQLAQKLQLHVFEPGERLHPAYDGVPKIYFLLSGECCVHVPESAEEIQLNALATDQNRNVAAFNHLKSSAKLLRHHGTDAVCCCETHAPGAISALHIGKLSDGDSYGESLLLSSSLNLKRSDAEGVLLSVPQACDDACYAVSVAVDDYFAARLSYLDTDFAVSTAYSILTSRPPRDRTCEQLGYLEIFFSRHSSAKSFFNQLPLAVVRQICLNATLDTHSVVGKELTCVQEQGAECTSLKILLDGYLRVFRTHAHLDQTKKNDQAFRSSSDQGDSMPTKHEDALMALTSQNPPCLAKGSAAFVEPIGVLCRGSAFGLLPVLLGSTSPFGYVAYAGGDSPGKAAQILSIPGGLARICLDRIDDQLVCHPVRALRQAVRAVRITPRLQLGATKKIQANDELERLLHHCPAIAGLPSTKLKSMIGRMQVVSVPANYFIFEAGEATKGCVFIVLEGHVRIYRGPLAEMKSEQKPSTRSKGGEQEFPATETVTSQDSVRALEPGIFAFSKPVNDDFFIRDYKHVVNCGLGDGFGRHGPLEASQSQTANQNRSCSKLSQLVRRATSRRFRQESAVYSVYPETAITVSHCRLGVLWSDGTPDDMYTLDPEVKEDLLAAMEGSDTDQHEVRGDETNSSLENARYQILERMGLAKRLTTQQLHITAEALRCIEISAGNTVYTCGEEGLAAFFILSGRVRLFNGRERNPGATRSPPTSSPDDFWSIDLCEGDAFGEESLIGGGRRLTTAVVMAGVNGNKTVKLVYLLRDDFIKASSPKWFSHEISQDHLSPATGYCPLLKRSTVNYWKAAVFQITRKRPRWSSQLEQEFRYRTGLTFTMVHHLPVFKDVPKQQCLEICKRCVVEVASLDSVVFERDEELVEQMFLVIEGSVTVQQVLDSPLPASGTSLSAAVASSDARGTKVPIRMLKPGEMFGEVELMLDSSRRLIEAVVSSTDTKLLRVPKAVFFGLWPQRDRLKSKLTTLKRAFNAASPLEPEQLCSIYYSVKELSFKRNEVVFGNCTPRGTLLVVQSGLCIMHSYVALQRKRRRKPSLRIPLQSAAGTPKLTINTPVASLGACTILFADDANDATNASARGWLTNSNTSIELHGAEYAVADSPIVNALSVELYRCNIETLATGAFSRRNQELFVLTLLGRGGLQTVRTAIAAQQKHRAESAAHSIRLAEATTPKENDFPLLSSHASPLKRITQISGHPAKLPGPPKQMDLLHYLRDRQLPKEPTRPNNIRKYSPLSRSAAMPRETAPISPVKSSIQALGSFATPSRNAEGLFPSLSRAGQCDCNQDTGHHDLQPYVDPAVVAASMRSAQLIKETRVIAELSNQPLQPKLGPKLDVATEKRQRHGRPPPRQLASRGRLVGIITPDTNMENDRKRSGLCRRLLHVKGNPGSK